MDQYCYHIRVINENSVEVKKWSPSLRQAHEIFGIFQKNKITEQIQENIQNLATLQAKQIQKVGEALFEALFDNQLKDDFFEFRKTVINKTEKLKVVLEINETAMPEVLAYPWELMCIPQRYNEAAIHFATDPNLSFCRSRYNLKEEDKYSIQLAKEEKITIALAVAIPTSDPQLNNVEYQQVQTNLQKLADQQEKIDFLPVINPATPMKVSKGLRENKPNIFHFIGHGQLKEENGETVGQIAFVDELGKADWKESSYFSLLFQQHRPKIVILQACETGKQSETNAFSSVAYQLMLQGIPVVIAMQYKVSNQTVSNFVNDFYHEIIKGNSVDLAVQQARYNILLNNGYQQGNFAIPLIYMNTFNSYLMPHQDFTAEPKPVIPESTKKIDIKKIIEEINIFFEDEASLSNFIFKNGDKVHRNLYQLYQKLRGSKDDYSTKVTSLIRELEKRNLTQKFIGIVREEYPNFYEN